MWKLGFILLLACLSIEAKGHEKKKHHAKPHKSHAEASMESEFDDDKRDAIATPYDYSQYQSQYKQNTAATNQAAAYTSSSPSSYPAAATAASADSFSATQRASVAAPQPAAAPAPAAPAPAVAPAAARAEPAPAPAAAAPAPAPAPAAPAPAPAAPAPAQATPAPAAAYPAPAPAAASSQTSQSRSGFPSAAAASSTYTYNYPSAAPAPAPAAAPSYYYRQPSTATATVAAAASQAASSTSAYTALLKGKSTATKGACSDDNRADHFCGKAHNPCYCEENHHFMYNYCKRSCNWCDASVAVGHRFWRIVNSAVLPRSWIIKEIQFFTDKKAKNPIRVDPSKAYASTTYPGYSASNAFDGKEDTYWLPEGWYERFPGMDYIGIQFDTPVSIGAVKVIHQKNEKNATSTKMYLESSDIYDNNYYKSFTMDNFKKKENKKYSYVDCPTYWRRFDNGEDIYCVKTVAEFLTWQQARDKCASFGSDLLSINSPQENMFINNELRLCGFTWIGLNDKHNESNFSWSDGNSITFKSWAGDESYYEQDEYLNSKQNCVAASRTGEWRPFHCDDKFYAVCKMKLKVPDDDEEDMESKGHYHHTRLSKKSSKAPQREEEEDEDDDDDTSGNSEIDVSGDDSDSEDALTEIKKNVKKAQHAASNKKTTEDEEDEDEDEDESGSGSDDDNKRPASNVHAKPSRKEEIEKVDDSFLDFKH